MKKISLIALIGLVVMFASCDRTQTSDQVLGQKQEQLMQEATAEIAMPSIKNFQERKLMKMILELRDQQNLICYAYIKNEMTGKPVFIGKCIGYGLPYATQFTNPIKTVKSGQYGIEQLPQADPNGLYMPLSAEATWLMLIDPRTNEPKPFFCEEKLMVSAFPLN